jgi:vacuolar-type H+-ATPase subunit E/Vma4
MDAHPLLDSMERLAQRESARLLDDARREADAVLVQAREDCARIREEALVAARDEAARAIEEARQEARAECERLALTHRQQIANAVLEGVAKAIADTVRRDDFGELVLLLLEEAMDGAPEDAIVRVPQEHAEGCRQWLATRYARTTVEPSADLNDGVLVTDPAGSYRVTNTLGSRYALASDAARKIAAKMLFGEDG